MADRSTVLAGVLFDLRAQYELDASRGETRSADEYALRFPGHEEFVRLECARLASGDADSTPPPTQPALDLDRRIAHFRLVRLLGRGGQGSVYLATDTRLGRSVALKLLSGLSCLTLEGRRRFQREAETASRLDHPSICTVYESGIDGDTPFISMRYIEGETLARRIAAARDAIGEFVHPCAPATRADLHRTLLYFEVAARALHAAHELGVVHRDVKPGNLMVSRADLPVILDFGLARETEGAQDSLTATGDVFGSPGYMSPEQMAPGPTRPDRRSDVYSLAVTLYECLTLEPPFQGTTLASLYHAILHDPPRDPRRWNRVVPRDLAVVLETALEKDRDRRYLTALHLAEDLRRIREHEAIRARPAGAVLRTARWVQRNPTRSLGFGAALLLSGIGTFGWMARVEAGRARDAQAQVETHRDVLALQKYDDDLRETLLDRVADMPFRGRFLDWRTSVEHDLDALRRFDLPLDDSVAEGETRRRIEAIRSRDPDLGAGVVDALYRAASALDDVVLRARRGEQPGLPADLSAAALEEPRWQVARARLGSTLASVERSEWCRELWTAFRLAVDARDASAFDDFLARTDLAQRSGAELLRLAEFLYQIRRDDTALPYFDAAEARFTSSPSVRYAIRISRGFMRYEAQRADAARADFDVAIDLRPSSVAPWLGRARAQVALGRLDAAAEDARRATEVASSHPNAWSLRARIALRRNDLAEARMAADRASALDPLDPTPHLVHGTVAVAERDARTAVDELGRAVELLANPDDVWNTALEALGPELVSESTQRWLDTLPADAHATAPFLGRCALALRGAGEAERAIELLRRACTMDPRDATLARVLGETLLAHADVEAARTELRRALDLDPGSSAARRSLAHTYDRTGEPLRGLDELLAAAASDGRDATLQAEIADLCIVLGKSAPAVEHARRACDAAAGSPAYRVLLARALAADGQHDAALPEYLRAFESGAGGVAAFEAFRTSARSARSAEDLLVRIKTARASSPRSTPLAIADALAGETSEALASLEDARERDPGNATLLAYLADGYLASGRWPDAATAAREAAEHADPLDAHLVRMLTHLDVEVGEPGRAAGRILDAIERRAADAQLRYLCGYALRIAGRADESVALFRELRARAPREPAIAFELAFALYDLGHIAEAEELLRSLALAGFVQASEIGVLLLAQLRSGDPAIALASAEAAASRARDAREADRVRREWIEPIARARVAEASPAPAGDELADLAWLRCAQGRFEESVALYESVFARRPAPGEAARIWAARALARCAESAPPSTAADRARAALDHLEIDLERRAARIAGTLTPEERDELARGLRATLYDRDLATVSRAPTGSPWARRARAHFDRARELLARWTRDG